MPDNKTSINKKTVKSPTTDISKNDDKSTNSFIFYMIIFMVIIASIGGYMAYILAKDYVLQTNKNKAQDKTLGLLEAKKDNLAKLRPNYDAIITKGANGKSDADLILNAMPQDEGYKQLIAMIERMGQESGVQIPSVSKSGAGSAAPGAASAVNPYQISISMSGTFDQVMTFINKTENSSRVMDFVNLSFSGSSKGGPVQSSATFTVYWQGPASIAPTEKELE